MAALNRKRTGNLAVRELAGVVEQEDAVSTENLTSLFVVVPKTSKSDWLGGYEKLSEFVVSLARRLRCRANILGCLSVRDEMPCSWLPTGDLVAATSYS